MSTKKINGPISVTDMVNPYVVRNPAGLKGNLKEYSNSMRDLVSTGLYQKTKSEFIERFEYENLPPGITKDLMERVLYYRSKGILFKVADRFLFLPFTLKSTDGAGIDVYGRYISAQPILFTGKASGKESLAFKDSFVIDIVYDETQIDKKKNLGVVLYDSSIGLSQTNPNVSDLVVPYVEQLSDLFTFTTMAAIDSVNPIYLQVESEDVAESAEDELQHIYERIREGKKFFITTNSMKLEEIPGGGRTSDAAGLFQSYQSLDNQRKDLLGLDSGGSFLKMEHMTDKETDTNSNSGTLVMKNSLRQREEFCELANKAFGLNMSVRLVENEQENMIEGEGSHTKQIKEGVE